MQEEHENTPVAGDDAQQEPSSGAVRRQAKDNDTGEGKSTIAAPVKSACTFCRVRKSRCNGKQPCAACINRGRTDDCVYTISRRGGKPKPKGDKLEPLEAHLEKLFGLSELPHTVRIPNLVPHLQPFHDPSNDFNFAQTIDPAHMNTNAANIATGNGAQTANPQAAFSPSVMSLPHSLLAQHNTGNAAASSSRQADLSGAPSAKAIIGDYYTHMYRFVPILPSSLYHDTISASILPCSPLLLALRCILPILRDRPLLPQAQLLGSDEARKMAVRTEAQYYARQAYEAIDHSLERIESQHEKDDAVIFEVIQALCILVIYEYGSGRALKSRLKVDAALTLAMSKGLHRLSPLSSRTVQNDASAYDARMRGLPPHFFTLIPEEEAYETKKRLWWSLWMMAMWTAYNTGRIPTVRADDSRITSELPSSADPTTNNMWLNVVKSLQALLVVQDRVLALTHMESGRMPADGRMSSPHPSSSSYGHSNFQSPAQTPFDSSRADAPQSFSGLPSALSREEILRSMNELDSAMQEQMRVIEQTTQGIVSSGAQSDPREDETQRILKYLWAIQVYTTSLTLHIGQAFQGASLFERKLCFLSSISEADDGAACQVPMPNAFDQDGGGGGDSSTTQQVVAMATGQDLYARGPFLPRDSLARCVAASDKLLCISRNLRRSEGHMASPNPFNACSFVLISFVCLMQALAISSSVSPTGEEWDTQPSQQREQQDHSSQNASAVAAGQGSLTTSTLLQNAQGAAALTSSALQSGSRSGGGPAVAQAPLPQQQHDTDMFNASHATPMPALLSLSRQAQLQEIWARVKEAKEALQGLSKYWDMVIPMREEVSGCLEASQFLLSQQP